MTRNNPIKQGDTFSGVPRNVLLSYKIHNFCAFTDIPAIQFMNLFSRARYDKVLLTEKKYNYKLCRFPTVNLCDYVVSVNSPEVLKK